MERVSSISERLKEYRTSHDLTFAEMEQITGVPAQTLNRYELGQRSPKLDVAVSIAESLGVHPMWLQGYSVPEKELPTVKDDEQSEDDKRIRELLARLSPEQKRVFLAQLIVLTGDQE